MEEKMNIVVKTRIKVDKYAKGVNPKDSKSKPFETITKDSKLSKKHTDILMERLGFTTKEDKEEVKDNVNGSR